MTPARPIDLLPRALNRRHWLAATPGVLGVLAIPGLATTANAPTRRPWPARQPVPPLALPMLDGRPWALAQARGRVVVLNFWASWCEPCRSELPTLELLAARHEADGLDVVAVNVRETDAAVRRFVERYPTTLAVLRDGDGAATQAWQVRVFPSTFVIGRDGRPLFAVVGEADWNAAPVRDWVADALAHRGGSTEPRPIQSNQRPREPR